MAGKTVMQELLCRGCYVEAAMQGLRCRNCHGEGVSGYGRRLLPWQFLRADIHDDRVLKEEGER